MSDQSSEALAREVGEVQEEARQRFLMGSARAEYEIGDSNRFYQESFGEQMDGLEEELMDVMNWAGMAIVKLRSIRARAQESIRFTD